MNKEKLRAKDTLRQMKLTLFGSEKHELWQRAFSTTVYFCFRSSKRTFLTAARSQEAQTIILSIMASTTTTAAAASWTGTKKEMDRDRLLKDVLMELPEGEDKGRFVEMCIEKIPDDVAFIDGVIVMSIVVRMKNIALALGVRAPIDPFEFGDGIGYEVDGNGRIIELSIESWARDDGREGDDDLPGLPDADMDFGFARLERLKAISIGPPFRFLPKDVSTLPHLEQLFFFDCSNLLNNFPIQLELPHLKKLEVESCRLKPSSNFLAWMAEPQSLQNLETLDFLCMEKEDTERVLDGLCNLDGVGFQHNLKKINMNECEIDYDLFEKLMTRVLPKFPNLSALYLPCNRHIQSVQPIVNRIRNDSSYYTAPTSIRELKVSLDKIKSDPKEKAAFLSFLQKFHLYTSYDSNFLTDAFLDAGRILQIILMCVKKIYRDSEAI